MFIDQELKNAIEKTRKKHPRISFDEHLARLFIGKVGELKNQMKFGEALRFALNHVAIHDRETRSAYASLGGTYFGRRGGLKRGQMKRAGINKQNIVRIRRPTTKEGKGGQFEFDI